MMSRNSIAAAVLALLAWAGAVPVPVRGESPAPSKAAAEMLPQSILAYVEIEDPKSVLSATVDHPLRKQIEESPAFREAMQRPEAQRLRDVVALMRMGGGITIAFEPLTQGVVALVKPDATHSADDVRDALVSLARAQAAKGGAQPPVETKAYRGLTAYHAGDAIVAELGTWVMICNKRPLAQRVADTFLDGAASLAQEEDFASARRLAAGQGTPPTAWAFARLAPIRLFARQPWMDPKSKSENPPIELMLGGLIPVAQNAPYVTASLWASRDSVRLAAAAPNDPAWLPADRKFFFAPPGDGAAKPLRPPGTLLSLTAYRDVAAMWQAGPDLFTESVATQMAQTDSGLSTVLGGKSLGDVLASFKPQIQFVVARQDFGDAVLKPKLQFPGAALVLEIKPDQFASVRKYFRVGFQNAVALGNLDGAQKGRALLELQTEHRGDCEIQFATYAADDAGKVDKNGRAPKEDTYLNLSPAMAVSGKRLILSTTRQLAEQLADLDASPNAGGTIAENTQLDANPRLAAELITANHEQLVAQNMLEKGHDRPTAEREITLLNAIVGSFSDARLRLLPEEKSIRLEVELKLAAGTGTHD